MNSLATAKKPFNKKILLFVALGIVVLAAGATGGLFYMANQATTEYTAKLNQVKGNLKTSLAKATEAFQNAATAGDREASSKALSDLATKLESDLDTVPAETNFMGIELVSQGAKTAKQDVITKTRALTDVLTSANSLVAYQKNVLEQVLKVQSLAGNTIVEQQALAASWQSVVEQLSTISPPAAAAEVHAKLVSIAGSIKDITAALPGLNTNKDSAGFIAKQKELEAKVAELKELGGEYATASSLQDEALAKAYADLQALLP